MESMNSLKEKILNYPKMFNKLGRINPNNLRITSTFMNSELFNNIIEKTPFLSNDCLIVERIYCILNDIDSQKLCEICDSPVNFINSEKGYQYTCSYVCSGSRTVNQVKATCKERYGVENPYQSEEIKEKIKRTNLEKYGVEYTSQRSDHSEKVRKTSRLRYNTDHPSQSMIVKEKMQATCKERYGVENPYQSEEIKEKIKRTNLEKYGVENYINIEKMQATCKERYGVENPYQSEEIKEKIKRTNLEKYGVEHYSQYESYNEKITNTNIERYGKKYYSQIHIDDDVLNKLNNKKWLIEQHITHGKTLVQIAHDLGTITTTTVGNYFKKFGIDVNINCEHSLPEKLLAQHIEDTLVTEIITNDRAIINPYEIDIYLPEYKLAIEFNGIYWHRPESYGGYDGWFKYHNHKINACAEKGIKLLHLWEGFENHNELIDKAIKGEINNDLDFVYKEVFN